MVRFACVSALLLTAAAAHGQTPPESGTDVELARAHFRTGEIYYERSRYADAAREFEEAYRLSQRAELSYNMGKAYDGGGDQARALGAYRRFIAAVKTSPDREAIVKRIEALARLVGRLKLSVNVDGASVQLDGQAIGSSPITDVVEVNPGGHALVITHEGHKSWKESFVAAPGAERAVEARLESLVQVKVVKQVIEVEKPALPVYKRWWLWTLVGAVVAAGVVTAAVLGSQEPPVQGAFAQLPAVK